VLEALRAQGIAGAKAAAVRVGPTVTTVIVRPPGGPGAARVLRLGEDLRFRLGVGGIMVRRAEGWPGCAAVEVPNERRARVSLRAVLARLRDAKGEMAAPLGVAADGAPLLTDLADWPHGLVAGATGAGKSVFVNAMLVSMLLRYRPDQLRLLLLDPKRVEFGLYRGLPHLARPIVAGIEDAVAALGDAVAEMRRRYAALERAGARKLSEYNARMPVPERLPRLLIVIDEAQALMADKDAAAEVVAASTDLAAMGRAAGVHLLYGTQYPLATVIPSALKANTPTRVALLVPSRVNSQVILDQDGAEALLGAGDMLVCVGGAAEVRRVQSAFVSEDEVRAVVDWWVRQGGADGRDDGDGGWRDGGTDRAPALALLRALAAEVAAQEEGLRSAHVAFVRRGEYVAVRREHAERVLRRMGADPAPVMAAWREAGWLRASGDPMTASVRAPWGARPRMLVLDWAAARPEDGAATG
jgi:S-DNA-T family DNA segregation ATPase FtsK/SpoIIIE